MTIGSSELYQQPQLPGAPSSSLPNDVVAAQDKLLDVVVRTADSLAQTAIAAVTPSLDGAMQQSDLTNTINYLLDDVVGLDQSSKLVEVLTKPVVDKDGLVTVDFEFSLGAWPTAVLDHLPSLKILHKELDPQKLAHDYEYTFKIQEEIKNQLDSAVSSVVDAAVGNTQGYEHGIAAAASNSIKALLSSHIVTSVSKELANSLQDLSLPDRDGILTSLDTTFKQISGDYFKLFVPEIAKVYGKLGLSEILTAATSGLSPDWSAAVRSLGRGVFEPIINNIVSNYFAEADAARPVLNGIDFSNVFGNAIAGVLVDFDSLDKKIVDDILGIDGHGWLETTISEFLTKNINALVNDSFRDAINFLSGKIAISDIEKFFTDFEAEISVAGIQNLVGQLFTNYAGSQLAQLVVNIDSLPEALVSQFASYVAGGAIGDAISAITLSAVSDLFGSAAAGAIGGAVFNGITAILGAGVGAIAGSVIFDLLDNVFDGAISGFFNKIIDWVRNDSPQAFYEVKFNSSQNQFVFQYEYSKDSNDEMRAAVKALSDAFQNKVEAVIDFVGQQAAFDPGYDDIWTVWGKKHFDKKYASFFGGNENAKLGYSADPTTVVNDTIGAVLEHMNFSSGNPILAEAYELWKAKIATQTDGGNAAYATADALAELQSIVGLAHFANGYRQDPEIYDRLMGSDAAIGVTILQQFLEAQSHGFNDATVLRGSQLGVETVGSAAAGDIIYLDGAAWRAIARGGNDIIYTGAAPGQFIDGGAGDDTIVLSRTRADYVAIVADANAKDAVLTDSLSGAKITVKDVETFRFNGADLSFAEAFPNHSPTISSNGGGSSGLAQVIANTTAMIMVRASDEDGNSITYSIDGGADAALFKIEAATGRLSFISAPQAYDPKDSDGDNVYEVVVGASDGRLADSQTLAIRVVTSGNTVQGTAGHDVVSINTLLNAQPGATDLDDIIYAGSGNDVIHAGAGADFVLGDGGDDMLDGEAGDDILFGWIGNDSLKGGVGNDFLSGEDGDDLLDGGTGDDRMWGGPGDDVLYGGPGNDVIVGGVGSDFIDGGSDDNTAVFSSQRVEYTLLKRSDGSIQVLGPDGLDILTNIQHLQFVDDVLDADSLPIAKDEMAPGPDSAGSELGGVVYDWKGLELLHGVTVSAIGSGHPVGIGAAPIEFRNVHLDLNGALVAELWGNSPSGVGSFDIGLTLPKGTTGSFANGAVPADWTVLVNSDPNGALWVGAFGLTPVEGSINLGAFTFVLPPESRQIGIQVTSADLGNASTVPFVLSYGTVDTGSDGQFVLTNLSPDQYTVVGSRGIEDVGHAVTAADALAALKLSVRLNPNPDPDGSGVLTAPEISPFQFIAADMNGDGRVTAADALAILRTAVNEPGAKVPRWLFVNEKMMFLNENGTGSAVSAASVPSLSSFAESVSGITLTDLVGVLVGDVNGSWHPLDGSVNIPMTGASFNLDQVTLSDPSPIAEFSKDL